MKRYDTGGGWSTEAAHGKWVLYEDSRELVAALQVAHEMEVKDLKAEIDKLKAELAAPKASPKVLSAEEVVESGWYWARSNEGDEWEICYLIGACEDGDMSELTGQFIGPIRTPEV